MAAPTERKLKTIADVAEGSGGAMRVLVLGGSRVGKSSVINALLTKDALSKKVMSTPALCADQHVSNGTTDHISAYISRNQGCSLIDTIGFTDPRFSPEQITSNMYDILFNYRIGFSEIMLVLKHDVFTEAESRLVGLFEKLLGADFYRHAVLVVTHFEGEPTTFAAYKALRHERKFLSFLDKFGNRGVVGSFQQDENPTIDELLVARRETFKRKILECLDNMGGHALRLQLRMRPGYFRDFFVVLVEFFGFVQKSEGQKIYEAFAANSANPFQTSIHFSDCLCPICLELVENDVFISPCLHVAHFDCIRVWVFEHSTCPVCRKDILAFAVPPQGARPPPHGQETWKL